MIPTSEFAGALVGLPFAPPVRLAILLLGDGAVFYAFYLCHRRRYC